MKREDLEELRKTPHSHLGEATAAYFEGEVTTKTLRELARRIAADSMGKPERACIVYGYGSQPTAVYDGFRQESGLEVIWDADWGPWWLAPLRWTAASHGGLIEVVDLAKLPAVFGQLVDRAMAELYTFDRTLLDTVVGYVRRNAWRSFVIQVIGRDPGYFCLGADGMPAVSPDDLCGWISYGRSCPEGLQRLTDELVAGGSQGAPLIS